MAAEQKESEMQAFIPKTHLGYFTEDKSTMDHYVTLQQYVEAMQVKAQSLTTGGWVKGTGMVKLHVAAMKVKAQSLATGGWDEGTDRVNLKCIDKDHKATMVLHDEQRWKEGRGSVRYSWNMNFIYQAPQEELSTMFQTLKNHGSVQVFGHSVVSMSPAFMVDTRSFLPIYYLGGTCTDGKAPGAVERDYDGGVLIFPVRGGGDFTNCVTIYDEQWEVQESIVDVNRKEIDQIKCLKEKGFHEIQVVDDVIVMGRNRLALVGYRDGGGWKPHHAT